MPLRHIHTRPLVPYTTTRLQFVIIAILITIVLLMTAFLSSTVAVAKDVIFVELGFVFNLVRDDFFLNPKSMSTTHSVRAYFWPVVTYQHISTSAGSMSSHAYVIVFNTLTALSAFYLCAEANFSQHVIFPSLKGQRPHHDLRRRHRRQARLDLFDIQLTFHRVHFQRNLPAIFDIPIDSFIDMAENGIRQVRVWTEAAVTRQ